MAHCVAAAGGGVGPGSQVGIIGNAQVASRWARLGRVRIVAEVPVADAWLFTGGDERTVASVLKAFRRTPARVLLAEKVPSGASWRDWTPIVGTPYALLRLED